MDVITALFGIFILLMLSVYKGIGIYYPLFAGLVVIIVIAYKRGFKLKELIKMVLNGARKSFIIINIFVLIGAITAVWRASGTVAYVVYYGIRFMDPNYFILHAFVLCCVVSFLLGTALGTVGTIGMILMVMVKGGDLNINLVAGAIIAGSYFGDRCSPMSSSANLVAAITDTNLYTNVRNMFRTSMIPFIISIIIYGILSFQNPLYIGESEISTEIMKTFNLNWIVVFPAVIILVLAAFRVEVKRSMLISIVSGVVVAVLIQKELIVDMVRYIAIGYSMNEQSFLGDIIEGGGIASMLSVTLVILLSFALSGVFEGTSLLKDVEVYIYRLGGKIGIFPTMIVTSILAASFGCSQTLAIMLTYQLVKNMYDSAAIDKYELAVDIEDTVIVISALVPWNIAGAVPAAALTADSSYTIYSYYLYLLPLASLIAKKFRFQNRHKTI
ncbi:MAG: Na+/H+ antiporter NhaC family protein [Clostridiaceae bacterium]|nr:Na+/H+ antiporter NhaC family protein [Clostridiaceae bacterium]